MEENYAENVKRGADLLDEKRPGWREEIDLATLDLVDGDYCIMGQIFGSYETGLSFLWGINTVVLLSDGEAESEDLSVAHGFTIDRPLRSHKWRVLQEAWIAGLREPSVL